MDREDLDRDLQKKAAKCRCRIPWEHIRKNGWPQRQPHLIVGFAGGCTLHDLPFMKSPGTESNYKMPESSAGENFDLPAIRNTAVVEAVKRSGLLWWASRRRSMTETYSTAVLKWGRVSAPVSFLIKRIYRNKQSCSRGQ